MKKKLATVIAMTVLLATVATSSAFAHGHKGGHRSSQTTTYTQCSTVDCNISGNHRHGSTTYAGHSINDGHTYHNVCTLENCTLTGSHTHDNVHYWGHKNQGCRN